MRMKESGIAWVGSIPDNWRTIRIKHLKNGEENSFIDGDWIESPYITDKGIRYYTTGNIGDGYFKDQGNGYISEATFKELQCKYAYAGELVFSRLNAPYGRSCILPEKPEKCVLAVDNVILRTNENKKYICYVTQCFGYQDSVFDKAAGTTMKRISRTNLGNIRIPLPPLHEQQAIASYLDDRCSKIDEIIAEAEKSIEEYKELKQAVIFEAVTKGLDKNVPMKDSGVEWIGEIPVAWSVRKLKTLLLKPLQYGANESGVEYDEQLPRYIRITDVTSEGGLKTEGKLSLTEEQAQSYILDDKDILFARSGGTVGKAFFYRVEYGYSAFAGYMIRAKVDSHIINPELVYYATLASNYNDWKAITMTQATIPNIGASKYADFSVVVPIKEEQDELVEYLRRSTEKIDALISEKQALIEDLQAYKKSIIYEVVTGKRRVV